MSFSFQRLTGFHNFYQNYDFFSSGNNDKSPLVSLLLIVSVHTALSLPPLPSSSPCVTQRVVINHQGAHSSLLAPLPFPSSFPCISKKLVINHHNTNNFLLVPSCLRHESLRSDLQFYLIAFSLKLLMKQFCQNLFH